MVLVLPVPVRHRRTLQWQSVRELVSSKSPTSLLLRTYLDVPFASLQQWQGFGQILVCDGDILLERKLLILGELCDVRLLLCHDCRSVDWERAAMNVKWNTNDGQLCSKEGQRSWSWYTVRYSGIQCSVKHVKPWRHGSPDYHNVSIALSSMGA